MRLWIMSDLHVDLATGWDLPAVRPAFDVMVVGGDVTSRMERGVTWLRGRVHDKPVIYIPGNHEGYGADIDRTVDKARVAAAGTNVHVLQDDTVVIDGTRFIGCTLWTDFALCGDVPAAMRKAGEVMNDYRRIRVQNYGLRLDPKTTLARHRRSRAFLERELSRPFAGSTVVVTHHAPDPGAISGSSQGVLSAAFASDLTELIVAGGPSLWVHGHIHASGTRAVGKTRIISNPRGYPPPDHNPAFDVMLTVDV